MLLKIGGLTRAQLHELQRLAKQTSDNIKQHRQTQQQVRNIYNIYVTC